MGKDKKPSTEKSFNPLYLIIDEPVYNSDGLGLLPHAKVIAGTALGTKGPFNIGIYGNWGQGKSSILKIVKNLFDENIECSDVTTVWFNAWQYEKEEHPIIPLIASIVSAIEEKTKEGHPIKESVKKNLTKLGRILRAAAYGFSVKTKVAIPGYPELEAGFIAKEMIDRYDKIKLTSDPLLDRSLYFKAFDRLSELNKETKEAELPKIIILVDDLDRCLPAQAFKLLEGIKLALNQPGFVFILAVDRRILEGYLIKKYKDDGVERYEECGNQYLDKIVQLPIFIPNHESRFGNFIEHLIRNNKALNSEHNKGVRETVSSLKEVLSIGSDYNPRALIRFINNLIIDRQLLYSIVGSKIDKEFIEICAVCRILREHLKDDYRVLIENKEIKEVLGRITGDNVLESIAKIKQTERIAHLLKRFERDEFLLKVIQTTAGKKWLTNDKTRKEIDDFIIMEGKELKEKSTDNMKIVENALKNYVGIMYGDDDYDVWFIDVQESVYTLDLRSTEITDEALSYLGGLKNLEELDLGYTKVTGSGLQQIKALKNIQRLDLSHTLIKDDGLVCLREFKKLEILNLNSCMISETGLANIAGLENLQILTLSGVKLKDARLGFLHNLTKLQELDLSYTDITDVASVSFLELEQMTSLDLSNNDISGAGLANILTLANLETLHLSYTKIKDSDLRDIAKLSKLKRLGLDGTIIHDKSLDYLKDLKHLQELTLPRENISTEAVNKLKSFNNSLRVIRY